VSTPGLLKQNFFFKNQPNKKKKPCGAARAFSWANGSQPCGGWWRQSLLVVFVPDPGTFIHGHHYLFAVGAMAGRPFRRRVGPATTLRWDGRGSGKAKWKASAGASATTAGKRAGRVGLHPGRKAKTHSVCVVSTALGVLFGQNHKVQRFPKPRVSRQGPSAPINVLVLRRVGVKPFQRVRGQGRKVLDGSGAEACCNALGTTSATGNGSSADFWQRTGKTTRKKNTRAKPARPKRVIATMSCTPELSGPSESGCFRPPTRRVGLWRAPCSLCARRA